jgi:hypothetical protein
VAENASNQLASANPYPKTCTEMQRADLDQRHSSLVQNELVSEQFAVINRVNA